MLNGAATLAEDADGTATGRLAASPSSLMPLLSDLRRCFSFVAPESWRLLLPLASSALVTALLVVDASTLRCCALRFAAGGSVYSHVSPRRSHWRHGSSPSQRSLRVRQKRHARMARRVGLPSSATAMLSCDADAGMLLWGRAEVGVVTSDEGPLALVRLAGKGAIADRILGGALVLI
jgi:hypothetical protein